MSRSSARPLRELADDLEGALGEPSRADSVAASRELIDRALALAEVARERTAEVSDPVLLALGRLAARLAEADRHESACRVLSAALEAGGDNPPGDGFLLAMLHDQLSESLQSAGRSEEALAHARLAEERGFSASRPEDPRLIGLLNNLGTAYKRAGDFLTAEVYFRRALERADDQGRPPDALSATAALNLADVLRTQGKEEALAWAERGLAETEEAYGPASFETADAAADLASLLWDLGRAEAARRRLRRAASLYERSLGADHELTRAAQKRLEAWEGTAS